MKRLFYICTLIPVFVIQCLCFPLNGYAKTNNAIIEESYQQEFKGTIINDSDGNYISVIIITITVIKLPKKIATLTMRRIKG